MYIYLIRKASKWLKSLAASTLLQRLQLVSCLLLLILRQEPHPDLDRNQTKKTDLGPDMDRHQNFAEPLRLALIKHHRHIADFIPSGGYFP
jgi:hypothetical protein